MKILFVFDNVEKTDQTFDCLTYFRQVINTMPNKPQILITTRNSTYGGTYISHLNLNFLSQNEAVEMVKQHLVNLLMTDGEVRQLVNLLYCFPLAIKQATAYILNKNEVAKNIGSQYTITQYIETYNKKEEKLLDFQFDDDFGNEYSQTTYMTWNVTIDAIRKQKHGEDAIRILEYIAYFDADKIDFNILKLLLQDPDKIGHVIKLLETYSLINKVNKYNVPLYNMHRLVQNVTRIRNKNSEKEIQILHDLLELISRNEKIKKFNISTDNINQIIRFAFEHDSLIKSWYKHDFPTFSSTWFIWKMIHFAARFNVCSVIDSILKVDEKYDLNVKTNDDMKDTPLHIATKFGNTEFAKSLIDNKVLINTKDDHNETPLHYSITRKNLDVDNEMEQSLLHLASEEGNLEIVKYLVGKGAALNVVDSLGRTAFHVACEEGHTEIVKYFAEEVISYDFIVKEGLKGLQMACKSGRLEVLKYLVEKSIPIDSVDEKGQTLLHLACGSKSLETVKYLVDKGIPIDSVDNKGQTVMHFAVWQSENLDILKYFVEKGIALDVVDNEGSTVLHKACKSGNLKSVQFLVDKCMNLSSTNYNGLNVLHMAASNCWDGLKIIKFLIDQNVPINSVDNLGRTALDIALTCKNYEVIKFLRLKNIEIRKNDNLEKNSFD